MSKQMPETTASPVEKVQPDSKKTYSKTSSKNKLVITDELKQQANKV